MTWLLAGALVVSVAVAIHAVYNYRKHYALCLSLIEENSSQREYIALLIEQFNRVQHRFNQGVVEGMAKAYANARTDWIDRLDKSTPQERAFLLTWRWSPANDYDQARLMLNTELQTLTGSDVNYADYIINDAPKHMIKLS